MEPSSTVQAFYAAYPEESRLTLGPGQLEFERTKRILLRVLPPPPAEILDVGGAAGAYAFWLAEQGHRTHLVDLSARLLSEAGRRNAVAAWPLASSTCADARSLPFADATVQAVLLLGPLYHLPSAAERSDALREAYRVLGPAGTLVAAGISRYASALDGLCRRLDTDPAFVRIRDRDLRDGQHHNETRHPDYFTTAYFHRPDELRAELDDAGFIQTRVFGVEGPGWLTADFEHRWSDPVLREDMLGLAAALESEPAIVGASAHLLAIGRKRG